VWGGHEVKRRDEPLDDHYPRADGPQPTSKDRADRCDAACECILSFDYADFLDELTRNPHLFDESYTRWGPIQWMPPETLLAVGEHLGNRGWTDADIQAVTWQNFHRVAEQAWQPTAL
jgi:hypothetical protein